MSRPSSGDVPNSLTMPPARGQISCSANQVARGPSSDNGDDAFYGVRVRGRDVEVLAEPVDQAVRLDRMATSDCERVGALRRVHRPTGVGAGRTGSRDSPGIWSQFGEGALPHVPDGGPGRRQRRGTGLLPAPTAVDEGRQACAWASRDHSGSSPPSLFRARPTRSFCRSGKKSHCGCRGLLLMPYLCIASRRASRSTPFRAGPSFPRRCP